MEEEGDLRLRTDALFDEELDATLRLLVRED